MLFNSIDSLRNTSTSIAGGPQPHLEKFCIRHVTAAAIHLFEKFKKENNFLPFELVKEHFKPLKFVLITKLQKHMMPLPLILDLKESSKLELILSIIHHLNTFYQAFRVYFSS